MLSFEAFAITNFLMNLLIMWVSARGIKHFVWRRMLAASAVGTAYAAAAYLWKSPLGSAAMQAGCLFMMALILFGGGRKWLRGCRRMAGSAVFAGGVMMLLKRWIPSGNWLMPLLGCALIAAAAFAGDETQGGSGNGNAFVRLRICTGTGETEVEALIDTGNRLREPVSGLPVLIAGRKCLNGVLTEPVLSAADGRLPSGFRMVSYGVLGGHGEMMCFKPESVCIWQGGRWLEAPDVWIAIYPGCLPSGLEAIAPPVFARR